MLEQTTIGSPTPEDITVAGGEAPAATADLESQEQAQPQTETPEQLKALLAEKVDELQRTRADVERLQKISSKKANENYQLKQQAQLATQLKEEVVDLRRQMADWMSDLAKKQGGLGYDEDSESPRKGRDYVAEAEESIKKRQEAPAQTPASPEVEALFSYVQEVGLAPNDQKVIDSIREAGGDPEFALEKLRQKVPAKAAVSAPSQTGATQAQPDVETRAKELFEAWVAQQLQPGARQPATPGAYTSKDIEKMDMEQYMEFRKSHPNA